MPREQLDPERPPVDRPHEEPCDLYPVVCRFVADEGDAVLAVDVGLMPPGYETGSERGEEPDW
ncbi:hypothetical protein GCM10017691_19470 [Pseudonocardia petroleophila]